MPTTRKRVARGWSGGLTKDRRQELLIGPDRTLLAGDGYYPSLRYSTDDERAAGDAAMRDDWETYRAEIIAEFRAYSGPDEKPWAWWRFDATPAQRAEHIAKHGERG